MDNLTYDQAIRRIEEIVRELEQTEALSVSTYKQKAAEAQQLLRYCESQLREMESALSAKPE
ncbi:MAG: exodeoxyribonuclease VII small subunit [Paludibacteraceae bacterium]|jgi:Exonuclease VII small subunit.|nr:exodeoxyribonuclease VII small subunit [Paludibacteraceae bacterium]MBO7455011.1 exodeoxyribonuclease VII small subunit [Paludibacteraceae bacterium]